MFRYDTFLNPKTGKARLYPHNLPVLAAFWPNLDANAWTAYNQGLPFVRTVEQIYAMSENQRFPWHGQVLDVPSQLWADIDAGLLKITRTDVRQGYAGDSDAGATGVDCLADDHTFLGGIWTPMEDVDGSGTRSAECLVPPLTRKIRVHQRGFRVSTTSSECSAYFRDTTITFDISGYVNYPLYAIRGGEVTDWPTRTNLINYAGNADLRYIYNAYDETGSERSRGGGRGRQFRLDVAGDTGFQYHRDQRDCCCFGRW